jgi:RNA polymerase sigma factor (TIGR02999 family)
MNNVTQILSRITGGDPSAAEQLLPLVYDELRSLAARKLAREKPGQTLQATALVHEAYLRLTQGDPAWQWSDRRHFFATAAEAMRRILVETARRKQTEIRGGGRAQLPLIETDLISNATPAEILALDEALSRLAAADATVAELVKLRMFAGLSMTEVAKALDISRATAYRHWKFARAWLRAELRG